MVSKGYRRLEEQEVGLTLAQRLGCWTNFKSACCVCYRTRVGGNQQEREGGQSDKKVIILCKCVKL